MKELKELTVNPSAEFTACPLEEDLFEWHFTLRGPDEGGFQGGRYHGRIIFPFDYPFKPPNIVFLTRNGRFEVGKKICLSITGYHAETWRPAWGVRTALIAIISFFLTKGEGAIGALDWNEGDRARVALESRTWKCSICGSDNADCLPDEQQVPVSRLETESEIAFMSENKQVVEGGSVEGESSESREEVKEEKEDVDEQVEKVVVSDEMSESLATTEGTHTTRTTEEKDTEDAKLENAVAVEENPTETAAATTVIEQPTTTAHQPAVETMLASPAARLVFTIDVFLLVIGVVTSWLLYRLV
jgi:ubiquitin-conjugating enzyme E2 J1